MQFSLLFVVAGIASALIQVIVADSDSKLEFLVKEAVDLFSKTQTKSDFQSGFNDVIHHVNRLTLRDVHLTREFIEHQNRLKDPNEPGLLYMPIFENSHVSVGVFILKSDIELPPHDHPLMYGILKVLYGSANIQSYSHIGDTIKEREGEVYCLPSDQFFVEDDVLYPQSEFKVIRNSSITLSTTNDYAVVTPINNIHKVRAEDGPVAFIDVLAPPYFSIINDVGPRNCTYFEEVSSDSKTKTAILRETKPQMKYTSREIEFRGPKISVDS